MGTEKRDTNPNSPNGTGTVGRKTLTNFCGIMCFISFTVKTD
jgi:hypothetical protein